MKSPTAQSLKLLRDQGWTVQVVERWNPFAKRRVDLFGVVDILCMNSQSGFLGVQTTSASNVSARLTKIRNEPRALTWLEAGGKLIVHGWSKKGPRGKRKIWECRIEEITIENYDSKTTTS